MVEPWIEGLWGALEKVLLAREIDDCEDSESSSMAITTEETDHHGNNPNITTADPNSTVDNPNSTVDDNPNTPVDNPNTTVNSTVDNPNSTVDNPNSTVDNPNSTVNNIVDNPNSTGINPNSTPNRTADISDPQCSSHEAAIQSEKLANNVEKLQISSPPTLSNFDPNSPTQDQPLVDEIIDETRRNALQLSSCKQDEATLTLPSLPPAYIRVQLNEVHIE